MTSDLPALRPGDCGDWQTEMWCREVIGAILFRRPPAFPVAVSTDDEELIERVVGDVLAELITADPEQP